MLNDKQLADLFEKFASDNLNNKENELLKEWAAESPLNQEILKLLSGDSIYGDDIKAMLSYDESAAWKNIQKRSFSRTLNRRAIYAMAASLLVIVSFSFAKIRHDQIKVEKLLTSIEPGTSKAEFILPDGSMQILSEVVDYHPIIADDALAVVDASSIQNKVNKTPENITLQTPEGCEYQYTLSDGTKVWLNAMSSITFPREFDGDQRRVMMEGEVYFDVAKDASRPFIIDVTNYGQIKVLGTSFNVKAYEDRPTIETTLVEGRVWMTGNLGESVELTPGMQAVISREDQNLAAESVVDTEPMVAWKNGYFLFDNESLENICKEFSRWYNIDIEIDSKKLASKRYSLKVLRQMKFVDVLNMLEATRDMNFRVSKNNVIHLD